MEKQVEELIAKHIGHDDELKKYVEEHAKFEEAIEELNKKVYLTAEEEVQKKNLQKMKLSGKEQIYRILEKYQHPE